MKSWINRDESLTNPHITPDIHAAGADYQKDVSAAESCRPTL